jgi:pilus assembly protein CpaE
MLHPLTPVTFVQTKGLWDELQVSREELPVRSLFEISEIGDLGALFEKIDRMRPEVMFIDISMIPESLDRIVHGVRSTSTAPAVLTLNTGPDPEMNLNAMRAGAAEYLYPPFGEQVRIALERIGNDGTTLSQSKRPEGHTAAFVSAKGGCGATIVACHTAVELSQQGAGKILLADLDFDAGMISFLLKSKSPYNISDAVRNTQRLDANYWHALVSNGVSPSLEIITAPAPGARPPLGAEQLRFVLSFVRTQYDWTVLDLGRSINAASLGTLAEVDRLFLVATLDVPALHHAKIVIQKVLESGYARERIHLLLNRAPKRFDVSLQEIESMLGAAVFAIIPSDDAALNECYSEGKLLPAGADFRRHFNRLAMKIAGAGEPKSKKRFSLFG